jgi:hypothetical protein
MDELDTQVMAEISAQVEQGNTEPPAETQVETAPPETAPTEEEAPAPKMYDESVVKNLRAENAKYRIRARDAEAKLNSQQYTPPEEQGQQPNYANQYSGAPQQVYDPRVDDMLLDNKVAAIEADPYFAELFKETGPSGETFKEQLLEKALELQWPISELDALVFKLGRDKILGGIKQKGIDEAYKSMSAKAAAAPDRGVSSGRAVEEAEVKNIDDALRRAMKDEGVTDFSMLR